MLGSVAHLICVLSSVPDNRKRTLQACRRVMPSAQPLPSNKIKFSKPATSPCHSTLLPAWSNLQHWPKGGLRSSRVHAQMAALVIICPEQWLPCRIQATPPCMHDPTTMSCSHLMRTHTSHHDLPMPALPLITKPLEAAVGEVVPERLVDFAHEQVLSPCHEWNRHREVQEAVLIWLLREVRHGRCKLQQSFRELQPFWELQPCRQHPMVSPPAVARIEHFKQPTKGGVPSHHAGQRQVFQRPKGPPIES